MKFMVQAFIAATFAFLSNFAGAAQIEPPKEARYEGNEQVLERVVGPLDLGEVSPPWAVALVLAEAGLPGGIVQVEGCDPEPRRATTFQRAPLRQVLDAIVKANPRYKWSLQHDVVNVLPSAGPPPLLLVPVADFGSKDANNSSWATSMLLQLPEVVQEEKRLGLNRGPTRIELGMGPASKKGGKALPERVPLNVHVQRATVRDVLNAIARASGHGVWYYRESICEGESSYRISFSD